MDIPGSCDTFVALPPVTLYGYVIFGKNSDRPANEVQEVVYQPASENEAGSKLQVGAFHACRIKLSNLVAQVFLFIT